MTPTRYWITSLALDAAVAALVVATARGVPLAQTTMLLLVWTVTVGRALVAVTGTPETGAGRPPGYLAYHLAVESMLCLSLLLTGHPLTACAYLLAMVGFEWALHRDTAPQGATA